MTAMLDFIILVSAVFEAAVIYAAMIALLTYLENRTVIQDREDLWKKDESDGHSLF